jgi:hypothetical protein
MILSLYDTCPICNTPGGRGHQCPRCVVCDRILVAGRSHRCPKAVLSALKAAATRAENQDDPTHPALPPFARRKQSYDDRLAVGFAMMGGES